MKALFLLLLASLPAHACPDFSGSYLSTDEDIDIQLTLAQSGCESAQGHYDYGYGGYVFDRRMIFDGVKRPLDTPEGSLWLEGFHWEGEALLVENEYHSHVSNTVSYSKGRIYRDAARNLYEETIHYDQDWRETARSTYSYKRAPSK